MKPGWWREAACANIGREDVFFPEREGGRKKAPYLVGPEARAVAVCSRCPVRISCVEAALTDRPLRIFNFEESVSSPVLGVWGGTLPADRKGRTPEDAPALAEFALRRAIAEGVAPAWAADLEAS